MRVIALFLMMLASLPAFAQSNYAELSGTVLDPERAAIVGAKCAGSGNRDGNSLGIDRIEKNRMQTHPACARLPFRSRIVATQAGEFLPRFSAVF